MNKLPLGVPAGGSGNGKTRNCSLNQLAKGKLERNQRVGENVSKSRKNLRRTKG